MTHARDVSSGRTGMADGYLDAVYGRPGRSPFAPWLRRLPLIDDLLGGAGAWLPARDQGSVVDVGCGSGAFLARMQRRGWQVAGVEPDPAAAAVARRVQGLTVVDRTSALGSLRFDAVTMHHVIEHLPDPPATVRELAAHMAPGGRLVIVTPNIHSLGRRRFGGAWVHWDPPRHLRLFSLTSLVAVVEAGGLVVERSWTTGRNARFVGAQAAPIARTGRATPGAPAPAARLRGLAFQLREQLQGVFDTEAGEELVVIATAAGAR